MLETGGMTLPYANLAAPRPGESSPCSVEIRYDIRKICRVIAANLAQLQTSNQRFVYWFFFKEKHFTEKNLLGDTVHTIYQTQIFLVHSVE